ncbi:MAG: TonB-dependent receptor [Armatimonadetes bacterium]|nr:TonB-dependent receptor [Armatimonadota bacterium]
MKFDRASIILMLFLIPCFAFSQQTGSIKGVIRDDVGKPIEGVTIKVQETKSGAISNDAGAFIIQNLQTGNYNLIITSIGYDTGRVSVVVQPSHQTEVSISLLQRVANSTGVVVTARANKETMGYARTAEKNAASVVNNLSAEEIARYPDPSTAESMQRIPGVSVTRVRGEVRDAIVRGLESRYNSILVDGVRAPSPSTNTRVLQMDFLPSDLLQRIEVAKSLTPDMEGDAIGGSVNLVMKTAPDTLIAQAKIGTGYSAQLINTNFTSFPTDSIFEDPLKRFGTTYQAQVNDFPRNYFKMSSKPASPDIFGDITLGNRFLDGHLGVIMAGSVQQTYRYSQAVRNYDAIDADNNEYLIRRQHRFHSHDKTKWGLNTKVDYIFNKENEVNISFNGFVRRNVETRILGDSNYVYQPVLYNCIRSVVQTYTLANTVVSGKHAFGDLSLGWRAGWLEARQFKPDRAELATVSELRENVVASQPVFYAIVHDWQHNEDRDIIGGLDISWKKWKNSGITINAGTLLKTKKRANAQNEYRLLPITDSAGNLPRFTNVDDLQWEVLNTGGTPEYGNNNYQCEEELYAGYLMGTWESGLWKAIAGVRTETTSGSYSTFDITQVQQVTASNSYTDILPSLHLRYTLSPESYLRFSLGRTISRPNFYDLVPYNSQGEDNRELGNPDLKRSQSTNVDIRYELYPSLIEQFSVGAFFKKIDDPIERAVDIRNPSLPSIQPRNFGSAMVYGGEFVVGVMLPYSLGVQAFYTWAYSTITADKVLFDRAAGQTLLVPETRALQGQSEHGGNIAISFNPAELGLFAQLSLVYTGQRIHSVSLYKDQNHLLDDYAALDFSCNKSIGSGLSLFLRLNNLLNMPYRIITQKGGLIEEEHFGSTAAIGLQWKLL